MPNNNDEDIIKMNTDINLTDSNGNPIIVETQPPEYIISTFTRKGVSKDDDQSS